MSAFIEETSNRLLPRIVLIACGSFSPPTPMHFRMFEIAKDHFEMKGTHKVIGGIVSPTHDAYGKKGLAPGKHRCAMAKLALQSSSWIRLSDWETQQEGWSRTQAVLQYHQNFMNNYINSPDLDNMNGDHHIPSWMPSSLKERHDPVQLKLLCGADLLESFAVPGLWSENDIEDIICNHGLVVISRSGSNAEKFIFDSDVLTKYQRNIHLVINWVSNEVSSTMIRRLLGRGQSVKYLIDDLVLEYIKQCALFQTKTKYITSLTKRPTKQQQTVLYINRQHRHQEQHVNMLLSSNETTPSDDDNDDSDNNMDETDFTLVKNIILSNNLDNRKAASSSSSNVFCCAGGGGDVDGENNGVIGKLLGQVNKKKSTTPGQAVQVITNEYGVTEVLEENQLLSKKVKVADNV